MLIFLVASIKTIACNNLDILLTQLACLYMIIQTNQFDFSTLLTASNVKTLLKRLVELETISANNSKSHETSATTRSLDESIRNISSINTLTSHQASEYAITNWLISLFNILFSTQRVELVRGNQEPEYFPAQNGRPARIEFAHGFFASALHEISHWCIAGEQRRGLSDFGYWYAPDGRTAAQQQAFERVEIKPQALECLFTLACRRSFEVSQDNLFADFDTSASTFSYDVYQKVIQYMTTPQTLPRDAKTLLRALLAINYS